MSSLIIKLKSFKAIFNLLSKKGVILRLLVLNSWLSLTGNKQEW